MVRRVHKIPPQHYQAKYLEGVLDESPLVSDELLELWDWIVAYYMCTPGEVMIASLPGMLRLSSETRILLDPDFEAHRFDLSSQEHLVLDVLESRTVLSLQEIATLLDRKNVQPLVRGLLEQGAVVIEEEIKEIYKPKLKKFVTLTEWTSDEANLGEIFNQLEKRAPKQLDMLMKFIQLSHWYQNRIDVDKLVLQKEADANASVVNAMVKKNIFEVYEREVGRIAEADIEQQDISELSKAQEDALHEIEDSFKQHDVTLLHGVTASGKTEIYVQLIQKAIENKEQVLYLVPEIALTTQLINRLQKYFGDQVGVYHSRYNQNERVEIWKELLLPVDESRFKVILGARSATLLPFTNLGLVIVDEEHETSFKQYDPAPRYNARDTAVMLANIHGAKCLLGSATPALESYYNAIHGKYGLVEITTRYGGVKLPEIWCADLKKERRKKQMTANFSSLLMEEMEQTLRNHEQIILFQNRRGYAPYLICTKCGHVPQCARCDISLTYHKLFKHLNCHYCGYTTEVPVTCEACGSNTLDFRGFGTEQIEEDLTEHFPNKVVARMDLDTTRAKQAYQQILEDFELRNIDILVGTQMVTKGLDFDNVGLVGVLNADSLLNFPDFRAWERSYQLIAQVSGRAGRSKKRGKVIVQTSNPEHSIIQFVMKNDYRGMFEMEMKEREKYMYPPFTRLIDISMRHKDIKKLNAGAKELTDRLKFRLGDMVLGPEFPVIPRIRNEYIKKTLIKADKSKSVRHIKEIIKEEMDTFASASKFRAVRIQLDVDPQ